MQSVYTRAVQWQNISGFARKFVWVVSKIKKVSDKFAITYFSETQF